MVMRMERKDKNRFRVGRNLTVINSRAVSAIARPVNDQERVAPLLARIFPNGSFPADAPLRAG